MSDSAKRLAVQPGTTRTLVLKEWPRMPESMLRRFPELRQWDEECNQVTKENARKVREYLEAQLAQTT